MLALLNVSGAPNNGTMGSLADVLRASPAVPLRPGVESEDSCTYPMSEEDYTERANISASGCHCDETPQVCV